MDIRLSTLADLCEKLNCKVEDIVEVVEEKRNNSQLNCIHRV